MATLLPVAVFGAVVGYFLVAEQRDTFRRGAEDRTLAVLTAIDAQLRGSITVLEALATLPAFDTGDFFVIRDRADRILAAQPHWTNVNLARPDGQQVMNLQMPPDARLPSIGSLDGSFAELRRTGRPVVSDLAVGPVLKRWSFAVRVPVRRGGELKYVLSAGIRSDSIGEVIRAQRLPADWIGVVVDRNGRIVARNVSLDGKEEGQLASASLRAALERTPSGWFRGSTLEGKEVYTPYRRSELTGWAFAMGIPARTVDAVATRGILLLGIGLLGALGIAFALAHAMSRRIARPIASLAAATGTIAQGGRPRMREAPAITEVGTLALALDEAAQATIERQQLVEREKIALQAADRAKDEFLAMLSHELRNPLAALSAAAHVLKTGHAPPDAARKARAVIERQTRHMARLVSDLLDIGSVSAGKIRLEREPLDVADTVRKVVATWRESGRFERHEVSLDAQEAWADADRARLEQITANLLDNALKFSPSGSTVAVTVRGEGADTVLRVADHGIGLQPGEGARIFGLFVQGEHGAGGMGVGLALVERLVALHGGSVSVASEGEGLGTVFTVRLPAVTRPDAQAAGEAPPRSRPASVLLVEDNEDLRQMLEAALASAGHAVRATGDGASGLALASESAPDVALIDIGLPGMDGYEVARRLRAAAAGRRLSLVAITGYGAPEDRRRALEAGFDAHLTKPVTPDRVIQALASLR